ncbi:hypothetical protein PVAND_010192 [Polypedilum vanderplanki]|uniref:Clathrin light chain n=1 Tax=Polypedilum vanderplanki TaxID=319348 RepID=A0A9J6CFI0_POLVA|nr:hypothetical protein PVAND_010192 [Polypedilum vanderplanki]
MELENDPAADFLNREKEMLGELENEISNTHNADSGPTSDDFVIVDNDIQENNNDNENEDAFAGMHFQKSLQKEEPEKIRIWKEQQALMLQEKDKEEKEAIEKLKEAGKKELEDWYKNNKSNLDKTKVNNRLDESNRNNDNNITEGQEVWKCVYNLCDFSQQKHSSGARDRMRNILLQLNQTPSTKNLA